MGREPKLWNDARIKLIKENFIAVAVPTEICYAKNPEGEFLRGAGIDKSWVTSSGYMNIYSGPVSESLELFIINAGGTGARQLTKFGGTSVSTPSA